MFVYNTVVLEGCFEVPRSALPTGCGQGNHCWGSNHRLYQRVQMLQTTKAIQVWVFYLNVTTGVNTDLGFTTFTATDL